MLPCAALAQAPAEWQHAAREIPYLNAGDFIADRQPGGNSGATRALLSPAEQQALLKVWHFANTTSEETIWKLAEDREPKVRTLALAAGWLQGNPKRLSDFATHMKDCSPTYPKLNVYSAIFPTRQPMEGAAAARTRFGLEAQTVGEVAASFVDTYLRAAGARTSFEEYWAARKHRPHCLSWFKVALDRASQGLITPPLSEERARRGSSWGSG